MKRLCVLLFAMCLMPVTLAAAETPDALIGRLANEILDKIRADAQLKSGDLTKISDFVDVP